MKANKFEPKESIKTFSRLCEELLKLTTKLQELDKAVPALRSGLSGKADKRDLQVCRHRSSTDVLDLYDS